MDHSSLFSLKSLAVFRTLFENGTTTKTASILGITQSGVSRSLAQLEDTTGLLLFIRQKNKLIATPEAEELYKEVLQLSFSIDELRHSVAALREFGASRMRIATIPGLAFGFVPQLISKMLRLNSKLNIYFDVMSSNEVVRSVDAGMFDLGFVTLPAKNSELQVDTLVKTEAICLLPKGHSLAVNQKIDVKDLVGQHLVIPNQPNIAADQLLESIEKHGVHISGKTEANISAICALVANNVGISVINPITASDLAHKNTISKPFEPSINYSFGLIYKKRWRGNKLIKMIHDSLELGKLNLAVSKSLPKNLSIISQ